MTVAERHNAIIDYLKNYGEIKVSEMVEMFGVSDVTARGDLATLEMQGLLKRVHGGAKNTTKTLQNLSHQGKMDANKEEKELIAKTIEEIVKDRTSMYISNGTTNVYIAKVLARKNNLTVMTNSMKVVDAFRETRNSKVMLFGGVYSFVEDVTYGIETIASLELYSPDLAIISIDGVSVEKGITIYNLQEVDVYKKMIQRANKVILAADHTKIGNQGLAEVGSIEDIDMIVTTKGAPQAELERIRKKGVEIICV